MHNLAHMMSQSLSRNGRSTDEILFETASITPSGLSLRKILYSSSGGMISLFMTSGVNHVSVPAITSALCVLIKAMKSGFLHPID